jgi:hypothetical protein
MSKRYLQTLIAAIIVLSTCLPAASVQAVSISPGQVVKMNGLTTLYYYASNGKRYVFPNERTFKSWFPDFNDVVTLSPLDLASIPLAGNVVYRPGVLLVKITTDPKVYAVTKNGVLRWITGESIARALYGDDWNLLIDDVPDSFFVNYMVGTAITSTSEYDPDTEVASVDTIEGNFNMAFGNVKRARTGRCHILRGSIVSVIARRCDLASLNTALPGAPTITSMAVSDGGDLGFVDSGDFVTITFSEPIDPKSVNANLSNSGTVTGISSSQTGGLSVSSTGKVTVRNIASFDLGSVESAGNFTSRLALNSTGKVLTVTISSGTDVGITDEDFSGTAQTGGTIKDTDGKFMESKSDLSDPTGSFGGSGAAGTAPSISSVEVTDGGDPNVVDIGDYITITFSEAVDPVSINPDLRRSSSVSGVSYSQTGGVSVSSTGKVTVRNIASFDMGTVASSGNFTSRLTLSSTGKVLSITLTSGSDIEITDESFSDATQTGGTVDGADGHAMESDSSLSDPTGSFGGNTSIGYPRVSSIEASDGGDVGYVDAGDYLTIAFSEPIDPKSVNTNLSKSGSVTGISYSQTGGLSVSSTGKVTVRNIAAFDLGSVGSSGNFTVKLSLNSTGKVLTVTITSGTDVSITEETFSSASQTGGTVEDVDGNAMESDSSLDTPTGSFGGNLTSGYPGVTSIEVYDGGIQGYVDAGDYLTVTFSEAIDPTSVHASLVKSSSVTGVAYDQTGGLSVSSAGKVTVRNIASFDLGSVESAGNFTSRLALNSTGKVLTVTITGGTDIGITDESFGGVTQVGSTVKDVDGNVMESDYGLDAPTGSFGGNLTSGSPHITSIEVSDGGDAGYVDAGDYLTITFSEAIDPTSVHADLIKSGSVTGVSYSQTGGLSVSSTGKVTVRNIASFDLGTVGGSFNYSSRLALNSTGKILTVTITSGSDIQITDETFSAATQTGGTVEDVDGNAMESASNLAAPTGTFGG